MTLKTITLVVGALLVASALAACGYAAAAPNPALVAAEAPRTPYVAPSASEIEASAAEPAQTPSVAPSATQAPSGGGVAPGADGHCPATHPIRVIAWSRPIPGLEQSRGFQDSDLLVGYGTRRATACYATFAEASEAGYASQWSHVTPAMVPTGELPALAPQPIDRVRVASAFRQCPTSYPIKVIGNIGLGSSAKGEGRYYVPGTRNYDFDYLGNQLCYVNEAAAVSHGFRRG